MTRKKPKENENAAVDDDTVAQSGATAGTPNAQDSGESAAPPETSGANENDQTPEARSWGPPYKAIFSSQKMGFEMGENRRFKQRVFVFKDKPAPEILAALKENGFIYRATEKAWTIMADAAGRAVSDDLARQFAGQTKGESRG